MNTFSILKTNPKLTSNVKIIQSQGDLFMGSLGNSIEQLGKDNLKKVSINPETPFNLQLSKFWSKIEDNFVYKLKDDEDYNVMYQQYSNQIDDEYICGAEYNKDNQYPEEFSFFAPLYVSKNTFSDYFFIFKAEGSGLDEIDSSNIRQSVFDNLKVVQSFNLNFETKLSKFIDNYVSQEDFPDYSIDFSFQENEFSYISGIDLENGGFIKKAKIFSDELENEMTFSEGHQLLTDAFQENKIIYPNILNFEYKFDDEVTRLTNPYSFNRYLGFYGNLEKITELNVYNPPQLKENLKLSVDNIFLLNGVPTDPFLGGFQSDKSNYVEFSGDYYLVKKIGDGNTFKVISDRELPENVNGNFNQNQVVIEEGNILKNKDGSDLNIQGISDITLIKIDQSFYRVLSKGSEVKILSDFHLTTFNNFLNIELHNSPTNSLNKTINLDKVSDEKPPLKFEVYSLKFNDIKNFDNDILRTEFAKFQYDIEDEIVDTDEEKLYEKNFNFKGSLKPPEQYIFKNKLKILPLSSEFLATSELFEITDNQTKPNILWKKNQSLVKWGIQESNSNFDYPYLFNNNKNGGLYNRTTNVSLKKPNRSAKNLDYFYNFSPSDTNFGFDSLVSQQSLSILGENKFDLKKYFGIETNQDHFKKVFDYTESYNQTQKRKQKFSRFLPGDQDLPNVTNFKGLKFSIYDVDSISVFNDVSKKINKIKVSSSNKFVGYKFSIIFDDLPYEIEDDFIEKKTDNIWIPIKKWERGKTYFPGDVVLYEGSKFKKNSQYGFPGYGLTQSQGEEQLEPYVFPNGEIEPFQTDSNDQLSETPPKGPNNGEDTLYQCLEENSVNSPDGILEDNIDSWVSYPPSGNNIIFYQPNREYQEWGPSVSYSDMISEENGDVNYKNYVSFYKGNYYKSKVKQIGKSPDFINISQQNNKRVLTWEKIKEFKETENHQENELFTLNGELFYFEEQTSKLRLIHSFQVNNNNEIDSYKIIKDSGIFYISPQRDSVFEDGINIYINEDFKNILIHIFTNNNLINFSDNRANYYNSNLFKFTANNFIDDINDPSRDTNLIKPVKYHIIKNGEIQTYKRDNIHQLPHILQVEGPVGLDIFKNGLIEKPINIPESILRINKKLPNNKFDSVNQKDFLSDRPISFEIDKNRNFNFDSKKETLFRHNGYYAPILKSIPLFDDDNKNFNENLDNFGEISEIIKSKVNENEDLLRLKTSQFESIFPQVDEIGYFVDSHNIFKSLFDKKYYKKTIVNR